MFSLIKKFFNSSIKSETKMEIIHVGTTFPEGGELEPLSPTWVFIQGWAQGELDRLRKKNDGLSLTNDQTVTLRGQIKLLKRILTLPDAGEKPAAGNGILNR